MTARPDRTEATAKFFALRGAGYRGPIDQDGHKVTSGPAVEILAALAERGGSGGGTGREGGRR
jgi:hypothetical protein